MRPASISHKTANALLASTTTKWRRIDDSMANEPSEDAVSCLSALGLIEVRIVARVEMGNQKTPKCFYVGGGAWWTLLDKELDRMIPAAWLGPDGKPRQFLAQRANVVSIRLTGDGCDCIEAGKTGDTAAWWARRPKRIKPYLQCVGIKMCQTHSPDFRSVTWAGTDYAFTKNQALCVKQLWAAWRNGTPEMDGVTVVTQANVCQARLLDVFRLKSEMHPAWNTMIVSGSTKGSYRMSDPTPAAVKKVGRSRKTHR